MQTIMPLDRQIWIMICEKTALISIYEMEVFVYSWLTNPWNIQLRSPHHVYRVLVFTLVAKMRRDLWVTNSHWWEALWCVLRVNNSLANHKLQLASIIPRHCFFLYLPFAACETPCNTNIFAQSKLDENSNYLFNFMPILNDSDTCNVNKCY